MPSVWTIYWLIGVAVTFWANPVSKAHKRTLAENIVYDIIVILLWPIAVTIMLFVMAVTRNTK